MSLAAIADAVAAHRLAIRGAFHPGPEDMAPEDAGTVILMGPDEPRFWAHFSASAEYGDGHSDPLDRWSKRILSPLAEQFGGSAVFPSDGPPYPAFIRWALASRAAWEAPVGLLVHDKAGLFSSYRGALMLPERLDLTDPPQKPCATCAARPCETACPVGAMGPGQMYDVPKCRAHVLSDAGQDCRMGCLVRRACPVSQRFGRLPAQSAFHMRAFIGQ